MSSTPAQPEPRGGTAGAQLGAPGSRLTDAGRAHGAHVAGAPLADEHPIFWRSRSTSRSTVWRTWAISRASIVVFWAILLFSPGDARYYFNSMSHFATLGPRHTMQEYPTPVLWLFQGLYAICAHNRLVFKFEFAFLMFLIDASFTWALWRFGDVRRGEAVVFWSVFLALVGPTAYLRFDLITAVLAGFSLLALGRHHYMRAGMYVGLGAAVKLWPALLWPALLGGTRKHKLNAFIGIAATGAAVVAASLWYAGWDRLVSPLHYQSDRGLQIESLWASLPMLWRVVRRHAYIVEVSRWNAWEIDGPMTHAMLKASSVSMMVGLAFVLVTYGVWLTRRTKRLSDAAGLMLLVILMMMVTNKTFSPQYIMWVGGPTAAAIALLPHSDREGVELPDAAAHQHADVAHLRVISRVLLVITGLTTLIYPIGYTPLVRDRWALLPAMTLILVARNLLLVYLFWLVSRWVWHSLRRSQR